MSSTTAADVYRAHTGHSLLSPDLLIPSAGCNSCLIYVSFFFYLCDFYSSPFSVFRFGFYLSVRLCSSELLIFVISDFVFSPFYVMSRSLNRIYVPNWDLRTKLCCV